MRSGIKRTAGYFLSIVSVVGILSDDLWAESLTRFEIIDQAMNSAEQKKQADINLPWDDISSMKNEATYADEEGLIPYNPSQEFPNNYHFEMGTELSRFEYTEPNNMEEEGNMFGIFASFINHFGEKKKIGSVKDAFVDASFPNVFKIDGRFNWGSLDYESANTGSLDEIKDFMVEGRSTFGYDLPFRQDFRITPFVGIGFRYVNDDSRGITTTGDAGYVRETHYFYSPAGFEVYKSLPNAFSLLAVFEYDFLWIGKQRSQLGDANLTLSRISNEQKQGYGLRGSLRLSKETGNFGFFMEPFIRYWKINDAKVTEVAYSGVLAGYGLEPSNSSTEYGLKLGFVY